MLQIAPEVVTVEGDAAAHDIRMADVLAATGVAASTWWRWRHKGIDPHLRTLRKVRSELDRLIVLKAEAGTASSCDAGSLGHRPDDGAEKSNANISGTGIAA